MGLPVCSRGLTPVWVNSWNTAKLPGSGSQVCSHRKSVSKRAPCLATSPLCSSHHTNTSPTQKPGHFQHHMRRLQQSRKYFSFFLKKNPKRLWPLLLDHNALAVSVYKLIWIGFSSPSTDSEVVTALGMRMRPCYRVEKGSGGLSGGWWDAATFIPGTRTVSVAGYLQSLDPGVQHWRIGLRGKCWVSSRLVRLGRLRLLPLMLLGVLCLAPAEAQAWPSVVVVAVATLGLEGMGCALCLGCSRWDWGTPPVQPADQHQGRQVGQTLSASPEGDSGWPGVRSKGLAAGWWVMSENEESMVSHVDLLGVLWWLVGGAGWRLFPGRRSAKGRGCWNPTSPTSSVWWEMAFLAPLHATHSTGCHFQGSALGLCRTALLQDYPSRLPQTWGALWSW